jgi:hypothetical protein
MVIPDFTPDCGACAALCCLALSFDAGEDFAIDKPAGLPCPNLATDFVCQLYDHLTEAGFSGCTRYDCHGAGQRVVQEVFDGANWRDTPDLTEPMIAAFAAMRKVHQGLELLIAAARLDLPDDLDAERDALIEAHAPEGGWDAAALDRFVADGIPARLRAFLPKLRAHV